MCNFFHLPYPPMADRRCRCNVLNIKLKSKNCYSLYLLIPWLYAFIQVIKKISSTNKRVWVLLSFLISLNSSLKLKIITSETPV